MITLAPIGCTEGEASDQRMTYIVDGTGFDFTGWTGTWAIYRRGAAVISGTMTLQVDGDMIWSMTKAQIALISQDDQARGRTLPDTYWQGTATNGTTTLVFRAAVTVIRGLHYTATLI
jgi:hypothetical protein